MDKLKIDTLETVSASKKLGIDSAIVLLNGATKLIICRGKTLEEIDLKTDKRSKKKLGELMLGPTGNLRAPTIKAGKTVIVGFNADAYKKALQR